MTERQRTIRRVHLAAALGVAGAAAFLIGLAGDRTALRLLAKPVPVLVMAAAVAASCRKANQPVAKLRHLEQRQPGASARGARNLPSESGSVSGKHSLRWNGVCAPCSMTAAGPGPLSSFATGCYGRRIAGGLLICAVGDVLLEVGERTFLAGVGAFLVGHLFYIAAFLGETRALRPWHAIPCALWGIGVVASLRPGLAERGMLWPVAVYTAVICTMLWRAAARFTPRSPTAPGALAALCGALLFVASDTLIAVHRFHLDASHPSAPVIRYGIIVLYWLGQLGIAGSALVRPLRSPSAEG